MDRYKYIKKALVVDSNHGTTTVREIDFQEWLLATNETHSKVIIEDQENLLTKMVLISNGVLQVNGVTLSKKYVRNLEGWYNYDVKVTDTVFTKEYLPKYYGIREFTEFVRTPVRRFFNMNWKNVANIKAGWYILMDDFQIKETPYLLITSNFKIEITKDTKRWLN